MIADIDTMLASLYHPELKTIDLSLARIEAFLEALGRPQDRLPPVIHVAGTNGKGSLIANLQAIFEAAGMRVHRYISPHLMRFNERIVLAGEEIDDDTLGGYLHKVQSMGQTHPVTFFEATTAAAFLAFSAQPADVLLLETGMGGRLDATNVIAQPMLTAITPLSLDHAEFLGDTLEKIAVEKAGILKHGVPCVVGPQEVSALQTIERIAGEKNAKLYRFGMDWQVDDEGHYRSAQRQMDIQPALAGVHQIYNAATAVACIDSIPPWGISDAAISQGIAAACWPARLQQLHGPLLALLPAGSELWLDGGHNPDAGIMLASWAAAKRDLPLVLICGMVKGKDTAEFLRPLAPHAQRLYAIGIPDELQSKPATEIAAAAAAVRLAAQTVESLEAALSLCGQPCRVLICGSLYLAGKVLSLSGKSAWKEGA